jgi:hypothetical protein
MSMSFWSAVNPMNGDQSTISTGQSEDVAVGGLGQIGLRQVTSTLSPQHPMFWFGCFALVTVGAIGASTHLRVGPFKADLDAGKD